MYTLTRRDLLANGGASLLGPPDEVPRARSFLWDEGGVNRCTKSVAWCIEQLPGLSSYDREYFLGQWDQFRGVGYDPMHPLVSFIPDGDQWQWQFFGRGEMVQNVVARPSLWHTGRSRRTITFRKLAPTRTHIVEVTVPEVCKNTSCRTRRVGSVHCIPPEVLKNCESITKHFKKK
ncbi:MAG: hypothetical protein QG621_470 [Patescibacteria group bacterium]|nr:hypothetical protein [Patescibacteria group bacterium]